MVVLHLDQLDVVRNVMVMPGESILRVTIRESIELFSMSVMPPLLAYLTKARLDIVSGILGLILNTNIDTVARTRIGVSILTIILSRAELIKYTGEVDDHEWK